MHNITRKGKFIIKPIRRRCYHCGKFIKKDNKSDFCNTKHEMFDKMKNEEGSSLSNRIYGQQFVYQKFFKAIPMKQGDTLNITWKIEGV